MTTTSLSERLRRRVQTFETRRKDRAPRGLTAYLVLAAMIVLALAVLSPFILVILNTFKSPADYTANGPLSIPTGIELGNIIGYVDRVDFGEKLLNSLVMSTVIAVGTVVLSLVTGYALGVGRVPWNGAILALVLVANILPQEALIYPLFTGVQSFNFSNALVPVIAILVVLYSTFGTYFVSSVMSTVPRAVIEAAEVDGASKLRVLISVVFPIIRPTLLVLFVFVFVWSWNEYFIPVTFLVDTTQQTVPIALAGLQGQRFLDPTTTAAASLLSLLPTFVFFLVFQRTLVRGVSVGAVK